MDILSRGAEGDICIVDNETLQKTRPEKPYRHPLLDRRIRQFRVKREFKVLSKLQEAGVLVPSPISLDQESFSFRMDFLHGTLLKEHLNWDLLCSGLNEIIKMHNEDIVHGDLTTMNLIATKSGVFLIDFGLADFSRKVEDKAVDLNLFFTCLKNEHPEMFTHKKLLEEHYIQDARFGEKIIGRMHAIAHRGRNKTKNQ